MLQESEPDRDSISLTKAGRKPCRNTRKEMTLKLEHTDCEKIAQEIAGYEDGRHTLYYSDLCIEVNFRCEVSGYKNDDYFTGTGEWITTSAEVIIISVNCGEVDVDCDTSEIERLAVRELMN